MTLGKSMKTHLRVVGVELDQEERARLRRRLAVKLAKCAPSIERVSIRLADANGPRGGLDQVCRINVVLVGLPMVVVEGRAAALAAAIDAAIVGAERAVRRSVQRRRMKPIRNGHDRGPFGSRVPRAAR
jgi:hypothetical protein